MAEEKSVDKAVVANIGGLVEYQNGSVVSRTIIDKKTGTITVFAFDAGQGLSEHVAPYDALIEVLDGEAEVIISGKSYQLGPGQMIILPAKKPHALRATRKFKMILTMIRA
jgi:quercetin dioxygenase-like cupin family protein